MARPGDLVVIGAGAWGLWAAWAGLARGLAVTLIEREEAGSGASGGPVGALAPHAPERWGPESAFQMRALDGLGAALAAVEATGGERSGYGRVGCLQPLATPQRRARAEARVAEAARLWGAGRVRILPADAAPGWIAPEAAAFGLLHDDLTARLDPPATCRALLAACRARDVCYLPGTEVTALGDGGVHTASGFVPAGAVVVAAGTGSFRLITAPGLRSGGGVKGQAMLLGAAATGQPVIHADDIFIVAHDDGTVGLGSTTERDWTDPRATDAALDALHDRAVALCPALRGVPVLRRWAGLRPRAEGRQPMVGALPGRSGVAVCTGGYKIGFAIGHLAGAAAVAAALGERPELPESYAPARS